MKKTCIRQLYRPTPAPMANLPFGARSVGHHFVTADHRETPAIKHFVEVFWGIAGAGIVIINGAERKLRPQQIAIYFPGMRHELYALDPTWEYCWWTMDGPLAASITASFGFAAGVYPAGAAPLALFRQLENTIRNQSKAAELKASALAYRLLTIAASGPQNEQNNSSINDAIKIIHSDWNSPQFCIKGLADRLHLNRSTFSRRFENAVGIPPVVYLTRLRVQNALSLLRQREKTISEVSVSCGFNDPNYFSRLIRRSTGVSPRSFRGETWEASKNTPPKLRLIEAKANKNFQKIIYES